MASCLSNIPTVTLDLGAVTPQVVKLNQTMGDGLVQAINYTIGSSFLNFSIGYYSRFGIILSNSGSSAVQV